MMEKEALLFWGMIFLAGIHVVLVGLSFKVYTEMVNEKLSSYRSQYIPPPTPSPERLWKRDEVPK